MTRRISVAVRLIILLVLVRLPAAAQGQKAVPQSQKGDPPASAMFAEIQDAVRAGDSSPLSKYLAKQVYLNLSDIEGGYFSDNQALFILKEYFKTRRILSFKFSTISEVEGTPFATGGGSYVRHGNPEIFQAYVAMKKSGDRWVIAQFSVF